MLLDQIIESFFHPLRSLDGFRNRGIAADTAPWPLWGAFSLIAIVGTLLYGASLGLLVEIGSYARHAIALTVAAGTGWLLFGPALSAFSRRDLWITAHVCLVTMVYGEAVLEAGFFLNIALWHWFRDTLTAQEAILINGGVIALSNVVMAVAVCAQMARLGFPIARTALLWITVLNGVGIGVWLLLHRVFILP